MELENMQELTVSSFTEMLGEFRDKGWDKVYLLRKEFKSLLGKVEVALKRTDTNLVVMEFHFHNSLDLPKGAVRFYADSTLKENGEEELMFLHVQNHVEEGQYVVQLSKITNYLMMNVFTYEF
mgnify:FL=1